MSTGKKESGPRVNHQIHADKIRLVDASGDMVGVVSVDEGIRRARALNLDLVEISPNAEPPVCKILDYGKYRYEVQKKSAEARKKQKVVQLKEIKLRPGIDTHDFEIKMKQADKFLAGGDKVKITLRFRGREMAHMDIGMQVMHRVKERIGETARIEMQPKMEGRQAMMILAPLHN